jgi:hypothetical protein
MQYILGETKFFPSLSRKVRAGETIELPKEEAEALNASHPGLLRAATVKTMAAPSVVRKKKARK